MQCLLNKKRKNVNDDKIIKRKWNRARLRKCKQAEIVADQWQLFIYGRIGNQPIRCMQESYSICFAYPAPYNVWKWRDVCDVIDLFFYLMRSESKASEKYLDEISDWRFGYFEYFHYSSYHFHSSLWLKAAKAILCYYLAGCFVLSITSIMNNWRNILNALYKCSSH